MTFRDDRDALLSQLEVLRDEAERQASEHAAREKELTERIDKLEQQLRAERRRTTRKSRLRWFVLLGVAGAATALIWNCQRMKAERRARLAKKTTRGPSTGRRTSSTYMVPTKPTASGAESLPLPLAIYFAERDYNQPSRPTAMAVLAVIAHRTGERARAAELLRRAEQHAIRAAPKARTKRNLGRLAVSHGTIACALAAVGRASGVAQHTSRADALMQRAFIYREQARGHAELARHCARMGQVQRGAAHLEQAVAAADRLDIRFTRVDQLLKLARLARRLKLDAGFKRAIKTLDPPKALQGPYGPLVLAQLAELGYRVSGGSTEAEALLSRYKGLRVTSAMQLAHLGRALAQLGRREEAEEALRRATEAARRSSYVSEHTLTTIAEGHVVLGQMDRAAALSRSGEVQAAVALSHLAAGRTAQAVAASQQIKRGDQQVAEALARDGQVEVAVTLCERTPGYGERAVCLGWIHAAAVKAGAKAR